MRHFMVLALGVYSLVASAAPVRAQRVGDTVSVIRRAEVSSGERVVGVVEVGDVLTIGAVEPDAFWVGAKTAGWIARENVLPTSAAEQHFSRRLEQDPSDAAAAYGLARIDFAAERWQAAIDGVTHAIDASPDTAAYHLARAAAHARLRKYDQALADCAEAMRLDPLDHQVYRIRAGIYCEQRNYREAINDYNIAARLLPNDGALNNDRAWLLATCPDDAYRNGSQAVRDATMACELCGWKSYNRLGTLAAAYAEAGDFDKAVEWQEKCVELAPMSRKQAAKSRLRLYESGKPYREVAGLWK